MESSHNPEDPKNLTDVEMDAATGETLLKHVAVSNVKSPRDVSSGHATGKTTQGFVADSLSFGVERE